MMEFFSCTSLTRLVTNTWVMYVRRISLSSQVHFKYFLDPIDANESKFDKILVANRGEIACRIIKTAKKMGIKTVAVYSLADSNAVHVRMADEAVCLGPSPIQESYLNIERLLEVIKRLNIPAVHPGYGFLSENATFVSILEKEGISFIGPNSKAIACMGDKLESKRIARSCGVNTIPGYDGIARNSDHCVQIAQDIGYPVIIKASAGGGGKGMRIAHNDIEAREGFRLSSEEASFNFGDTRMIVEKYIEKPRHIEFQMLSDLFGNTICLHERECSIQRRNQKIIEETPSVFVDKTTREKMILQAVSLCKHLGYSSVGTIEFLVDENKKFYFLEMNTRIQVEHPVTEFITGVDLVHQMIRIAKGHPLKFKQEDIRIKGWAIECRILAEDPYQHFGLPQTGKLFKYIEPVDPSETMVRCDSGVEEGSEISIYYDSMISKLICHAETRQETINVCLAALDAYVIRGLTHNIPLLRTILTEKKFVEGDISTCFLTDMYPNGFKRQPLHASAKKILLALAATVFCKVDERSYNFINQNRIATSINVPSIWKIVITLKNEEHSCRVKKLNNSYEICIQNDIFLVRDNFNLASHVIKTIVNEEEVIVQIQSKNAVGHIELIYEGTKHKLSVLSETASRLSKLLPKKSKSGVSNIISSPLPGIVKSMSCKPGDVVTEGQVICVIDQTPESCEKAIESDLRIIKNVFLHYKLQNYISFLRKTEVVTILIQSYKNQEGVEYTPSMYWCYQFILLYNYTAELHEFIL